MTPPLVEAVDLAKTYGGRRRLFRPRADVKADAALEMTAALAEAVNVLAASLGEPLPDRFYDAAEKIGLDSIVRPAQRKAA